MARREREILEHAVHTIADQAAKADELVDEAKAAGGGDHPVTVHAKMLRLELLKVKADLERELEDFSLNCTKCGLDVHWVSGLGLTRPLGAPGARAARRSGGLIGVRSRHGVNEMLERGSSRDLRVPHPSWRSVQPMRGARVRLEPRALPKAGCICGSVADCPSADS